MVAVHTWNEDQKLITCSLGSADVVVWLKQLDLGFAQSEQGRASDLLCARRV